MNVELIVDSTVDVPEHIRSRLTVVYKYKQKSFFYSQIL